MNQIEIKYSSLEGAARFARSASTQREIEDLIDVRFEWKLYHSKALNFSIVIIALKRPYSLYFRLKIKKIEIILGKNLRLMN